MNIKNSENKSKESNEGNEEEEEKKFEMPIQTVNVPKMGPFEDMEVDIFKDQYPKKLKTKMRKVYLHQNPIFKSNPVTKNSKNPEIYSVACGREIGLFATGYSNGEIHIFNKDKNVKIVQNSLETILSLKINEKNNNILLSVSSYGEVVNTHVPTGKKLNEFKIENLIVKSMDYSSIDDKIAIGFGEGMINIYDDNTQLLEKTIKKGTSFTSGHINQIHSVVFDKINNNRLISGGRDKRIIIWDLRNLECTAMVAEPYILGDTVDIKDHYILAGCYEPKQGVYLYDDRKFVDPLYKYRTDSHIYTSKFSKKKNSNLFAVAGYNRHSIKIYDINKRNDYLSGIEVNISPCYALDFSYDGSVLAYGCADGGLRIVELLNYG